MLVFAQPSFELYNKLLNIILPLTLWFLSLIVNTLPFVPLVPDILRHTEYQPPFLLSILKIDLNSLTQNLTQNDY